MARRGAEDWTRAAARRFVVPAVLAVIGIVLLVLGTNGDGLWIAGSALLGLAAVIALALVFLEVGLSEDRERSRRPPDGR